MAKLSGIFGIRTEDAGKLALQFYLDVFDMKVMPQEQRGRRNDFSFGRIFQSGHHPQ